ncbi:MAG: N-acetyltransferase [Thermoleophilia bacterium]|nr:N-acetyltransferase [Thermoleophilia bacterium]
MTTLRARTEIRAAGMAADFEGILAVYAANNWSHAREPGRLRIALDRADLALVAVTDDEIVGFIRTMSDGAFAVYIADILVVPEFHRQGIGSRLLCAALDHYPLTTFHHQVLIAEHDADGFYRRMGLSAVGTLGLTAFIRTRDK